MVKQPPNVITGRTAIVGGVFSLITLGLTYFPFFPMFYIQSLTNPAMSYSISFDGVLRGTVWTDSWWYADRSYLPSVVLVVVGAILLFVGGAVSYARKVKAPSAIIAPGIVLLVLSIIIFANTVFSDPIFDNVWCDMPSSWGPGSFFFGTGSSQFSCVMIYSAQWYAGSAVYLILLSGGISFIGCIVEWVALAQKKI